MSLLSNNSLITHINSNNLNEIVLSLMLEARKVNQNNQYLFNLESTISELYSKYDIENSIFEEFLIFLLDKLQIKNHMIKENEIVSNKEIERIVSSYDIEDIEESLLLYEIDILKIECMEIEKEIYIIEEVKKEEQKEEEEKINNLKNLHLDLTDKEQLLIKNIENLENSLIGVNQQKSEECKSTKDRLNLLSNSILSYLFFLKLNFSKSQLLFENKKNKQFLKSVASEEKLDFLINLIQKQFEEGNLNIHQLNDEVSKIEIMSNENFDELNRISLLVDCLLRNAFLKNICFYKESLYKSLNFDDSSSINNIKCEIENEISILIKSFPFLINEFYKENELYESNHISENIINILYSTIDLNDTSSSLIDIHINTKKLTNNFLFFYINSNQSMYFDLYNDYRIYRLYFILVEIKQKVDVYKKYYQDNYDYIVEIINYLNEKIKYSSQEHIKNKLDSQFQKQKLTVNETDWVLFQLEKYILIKKKEEIKFLDITKECHGQVCNVIQIEDLISNIWRYLISYEDYTKEINYNENSKLMSFNRNNIKKHYYAILEIYDYSLYYYRFPYDYLYNIVEDIIYKNKEVREFVLNRYLKMLE